MKGPASIIMDSKWNVVAQKNPTAQERTSYVPVDNMYIYRSQEDPFSTKNCEDYLSLSTSTSQDNSQAFNEQTTKTHSDVEKNVNKRKKQASERYFYKPSKISKTESVSMKVDEKS